MTTRSDRLPTWIGLRWMTGIPVSLPTQKWLEDNSRRRLVIVRPVRPLNTHLEPLVIARRGRAASLQFFSISSEKRSIDRTLLNAALSFTAKENKIDHIEDLNSTVLNKRMVFNMLQLP